MATNAEIESYLVRLGLPFEEVADGIWTVRDDSTGDTPIVVSHQQPLTIFRVKLMDRPRGDASKLFEKLLRLNAEDMISGAYGLEGESIVCVETLQSENLDFNEFQAAVESLLAAMAEHYPVLKEFRG